MRAELVACRNLGSGRALVIVLDDFEIGAQVPSIGDAPAPAAKPATSELVGAAKKCSSESASEGRLGFTPRDRRGAAEREQGRNCSNGAAVLRQASTAT